LLYIMTCRRVANLRLEEKSFLTPRRMPAQSQRSEDPTLDHIKFITPKPPSIKKPLVCPATPRRKRTLEAAFINWKASGEEKTKISRFELQTPKTWGGVASLRLEEKYFLTPRRMPAQSQRSEDLPIINHLKFTTSKPPSLTKPLVCLATPRRKRTLEDTLVKWKASGEEKTKSFELQALKRIRTSSSAGEVPFRITLG